MFFLWPAPSEDEPANFLGLFGRGFPTVVTANAVKPKGPSLNVLPQCWRVESLLRYRFAVGAFQEEPDLCTAGRSTLRSVLMKKYRVPVRRDQFRLADDEFITDGFAAMSALEHLADYVGDAGAVSRRADFDSLRYRGIQEH